MRSEAEIFGELEKLCASPGYAHLIALVCYRDNIIGFGEALQVNDLLKQYSTSRLIRTEISTLIGLFAKTVPDYTIPDPNTLEQYLDQTESLLDELHKSMTGVWFPDMTPETLRQPSFDPFANAQAMREPIFYGSESAYLFQYRDFARLKYAEDDAWLTANKGFTIGEATKVVAEICKLQNETLIPALTVMKRKPLQDWTILPAFMFSAGELCERLQLDKALITKILRAFTFPKKSRNSAFRNLSDYNEANARPIFEFGDDSYLLFQAYSLVEALYDSPFFWMASDRNYKDSAFHHRGRFTEQFAKSRLERVFGPQRVYCNVQIVDKNGDRVSEIDVLVIFGNRAIVLQAKAKRLTLEARKGNDLQLKADFKAAISSSYDQAYKCSAALLDPSLRLVLTDGSPLKIPYKLEEIYPVCVVCDHYPALTFQSRHFLDAKVTKTITPPIVTDIFALDAFSEMLDQPLRFLSYLNVRARFGKKLLATSELTILSFHLKRNLWVDSALDMFWLGDDFSADLDAAMMVRREGLPGKDTPEGILTRHADGAIGRVIRQIETRAEPVPIELGLFLVQLAEDSIGGLNKHIDRIRAMARQDLLNHDVGVGLPECSTGLTFHCSYRDHDPAMASLRHHCELRKYSQKFERWFGVLVHPDTGQVVAACKLEYPWVHDAQLESQTRALPINHQIRHRRNSFTGQKEKVGRNSKCPCGSGKKAKHCCFR